MDAGKLQGGFCNTYARSNLLGDTSCASVYGLVSNSPEQIWQFATKLPPNMSWQAGTTAQGLLSRLVIPE